MINLSERIDQAFEKIELKLLMIMAAPAIAGRKCVVHFKAPATVGLAGSVTIRPDGVPDIRLSPDLADLDLYLHELAHVRLHADQMPRSEMYEAPPESRPAYTYSEVKSDEDQADKLVNQWLRYGRKHAAPGDQLGIISALYNHYTKQKSEVTP